MAAHLLPNVSDALFASLAHLGFQRFAPHSRLLPWVQCYWVAQQPVPSAPASETVYFQKITGQTPGEYRYKKMSQKYNSSPSQIDTMGAHPNHPTGAHDERTY